MAVSSAVVPAQQPAPKKVALLVGVNLYAKRGLAGKPLKYAERDVAELAKLLTDQGFEATLLTGVRATKPDVDRAIAKVLTGRNADDVVLVALAGHGLQFKPELQKLPFGETICPFALSETHLGFDEYDVASQGLTSHHYNRNDGGTFGKWSIPFRYVWPAELDLMARLAGMSLRERWGGWKGEPFTADSTKHISVWEKTA